MGPADPAARDALLLSLMGSPDPRQIDGMGGADPLTSKVAVVSKSTREGIDVDYLFLQVFVDRALVTDAQNCGNILAGVGPFAIERGLVVQRADGAAARAEIMADDVVLAMVVGGRQVTRFLREQRLNVREALELDELEAIVRLVENGMGVALVPRAGLWLQRPTRLRVIELGALAVRGDGFRPPEVVDGFPLRTQPVARHITQTHDGLEVDVLAYRERDGYYITMRAIEAGEGAQRAAADCPCGRSGQFS